VSAHRSAISGDAINKAGRQHGVLSQRMGKTWLGLGQVGIQVRAARRALDQSTCLTANWLSSRSHPQATCGYVQLEASWSDYKAVLVGAAPHTRKK
jgi:hypothetical protein